MSQATVRGDVPELPVVAPDDLDSVAVVGVLGIPDELQAIPLRGHDDDVEVLVAPPVVIEL
ncbi:hypothetical protein B2G69_07465 [Methylorubrum zatmanii]|nr:hypothetical protein B2G69_07465 [Methylorubrum zatmanii]